MVGAFVRATVVGLTEPLAHEWFTDEELAHALADRGDDAWFPWISCEGRSGTVNGVSYSRRLRPFSPRGIATQPP